jgi:hypothetical protein
MSNKNFTYSFSTPHSAKEVFELLLHIDKWWSGLYGETITGKSEAINDEFSFAAGGGAHYSKQQLIELIPNNKIAWKVIDSKLSFLSDTGEWTGTTFSFHIATEGNGSRITFTHNGLVPEIECYNSCSNGWTQYLDQLKQKLA